LKKSNAADVKSRAVDLQLSLFKYYYQSMNIHGPKKLMDTKNNQNLRRLICSGMIAMSEYFTVTTLKSSLA